MSRSIFGGSYPPGAASDPSAPYNQIDPPCSLCGRGHDGDCECPECPVCGAVGDSSCYVLHGMTYTETQLAAIRERNITDTVDRAQAAFWAEVARRHPEAESGDLGVHASIAFDKACKEAVSAWLEANSTTRD